MLLIKHDLDHIILNFVIVCKVFLCRILVIFYDSSGRLISVFGGM